MNNKLIIGVALLLNISLCVFISCNDNEEKIDTDSPTIDMSTDAIFSIKCPIAYLGEELTVTPIFRDNIELGNYTISIHHNFDHHSHSTETGEHDDHDDDEDCDSGTPKTEEEIRQLQEQGRLFTYTKTYSIPAEQKEYRAEQRIIIPNTIEPGNYHFTVRVTDHAGWQSFKTYSLKIIAE